MTNVAPTAVIGPHVVLGDAATVEDFVRIGGTGGQPARIGARAILRAGTVIYDGADLGDDLQTGHHVVVRSGVRVGNGCILGSHAVLDGDLVVGNRVRLQTGVYVPPGTVIEDDCFLGPYAVLTNDRPMGSYVRNLVPRDQPLAGPTIRRAARVGARAVVLPGVEVGEDAVVGAGSVVVRDVPPRMLVVGVPAREIRGVPPHELLAGSDE